MVFINPAKLQSRNPTKHAQTFLIKGPLPFIVFPFSQVACNCPGSKTQKWLRCHLDQLSGHLSNAQAHEAMTEWAGGSNATVPAVAVTAEMVTVLVEAAGR